MILGTWTRIPPAPSQVRRDGRPVVGRDDADMNLLKDPSVIASNRQARGWCGLRRPLTQGRRPRLSQHRRDGFFARQLTLVSVRTFDDDFGQRSVGLALDLLFQEL